MPSFFTRPSAARSTSVAGRFLHPCREVADPQARRPSRWRRSDSVLGTLATSPASGPEIACEDENGVFDIARHGAEFVERPAQRHGAGARHAAVGWAQASDAAAHRGADDAAAGLASDREANQSGSGGRTGTCTRTGRAFFQQPRIHGLAAKPDVVERESAEAQLGDQHSTGGIQTRNDSAVFSGNAIAVGFCAVSGGNVGRVEQILRAPGNSVKRPAIMPSGNFGVGAACLLESVILVSA